MARLYTFRLLAQASKIVRPDLGTPRRWAVFAVGVVSLALGVVLTIVAGIGVGSWQLLETGLVAATGADLGLVILLESLAAVALAWLLFRQEPGPGTLIIAALVGPMVGALVDIIPEPTTFAGTAVMYTVGLVLLGLGVGLYVASDLGASAQDLLFVGFYRRVRVRPGVARFTLDATLVAAGWSLGGQIGVGTILLTFGLPPLVELSLQLGERLSGSQLPAPVDAGA